MGKIPELVELMTNDAQIIQRVKLKVNVKKETLRKSRNLSRKPDKEFSLVVI